ncbi:MAG: tetratricopeptide repeat protein, partial [Pseudomonadota bacterium]
VTIVTIVTIVAIVAVLSWQWYLSNTIKNPQTAVATKIIKSTPLTTMVNTATVNKTTDNKATVNETKLNKTKSVNKIELTKLTKQPKAKEVSKRITAQKTNTKIVLTKEKKPLQTNPFKDKKTYLIKVKRLVQQAKYAMHNNNESQVTRVLNKIEILAGKSSMVLLRLKAYWALQQSRNNTAQSFYQNILDQQPEDLEAGLNMALLDVRIGRYKNAITRLKQMKKIYPDSIQVKSFSKNLLASLEK